MTLLTKKAIITSVCLLAVLALLIAGYTLLKKSGEEEKTDGTVYVNKYLASDMTEISYSYEGADAVTLTKTANDGWSLAGDEKLPLDSSVIGNMTNAVSNLAATRTVETDDTSEFGFDAPVLEVAGKYKDGVALSLTVGKANDIVGGVYLRDNVSGKIYLVGSGVASQFSKAREDLILIDNFPSFDDENLVSFNVKNKNGDKSTVTDKVGLTDLADIFRTLSFKAKGAIYADADIRESHGVTSSSASVTVNYKSPTYVTNADGTTSSVLSDASFELLFGNIFEKDGQNLCYYTIPGSSLLYVTDEATYGILMRYSTYKAADAAE